LRRAGPVGCWSHQHQCAEPTSSQKLVWVRRWFRYPHRRGGLRGRSRGGLATKIHAIVDALGNPLALSLTGGHTHDITQTNTLVAQVEPKALLSDKGYDADSLINSLEVRAIKAVIPPKSNRKVKRDCDLALYAERNLVGRFFNTIKQYWGIATRYEKTARNFLAGLHLVCALAWLK